MVLRRRLKFTAFLALGLLASACSDSRLVGPTARTAYVRYMSEPGAVVADSFKTFLNDSAVPSLDGLRGLDTAFLDSIIIAKGDHAIRFYMRGQSGTRRSRAP
jgi:hypothetical protein